MVYIVVVFGIFGEVVEIFVWFGLVKKFLFWSLVWELLFEVLKEVVLCYSLVDEVFMDSGVCW